MPFLIALQALCWETCATACAWNALGPGAASRLPWPPIYACRNYKGVWNRQSHGDMRGTLVECKGCTPTALLLQVTAVCLLQCHVTHADTGPLRNPWMKARCDLSLVDENLQEAGTFLQQSASTMLELFACAARCRAVLPLLSRALTSSAACKQRESPALRKGQQGPKQFHAHKRAGHVELPGTKEAAWRGHSLLSCTAVSERMKDHKHDAARCTRGWSVCACAVFGMNQFGGRVSVDIHVSQLESSGSLSVALAGLPEYPARASQGARALRRRPRVAAFCPTREQRAGQRRPPAGLRIPAIVAGPPLPRCTAGSSPAKRLRESKIGPDTLTMGCWGTKSGREE